MGQPKTTLASALLKDGAIQCDSIKKDCEDKMVEAFQGFVQLLTVRLQGDFFTFDLLADHEGRTSTTTKFGPRSKEGGYPGGGPLATAYGFSAQEVQINLVRDEDGNEVTTSGKERVQSAMGVTIQ